MQVILLEKIGKLGQLGDTVEVKSGYARNYLLPLGKATEATPANLQKLEERRAELEAKQAAILADATERGEKLSGIVITMSVKAGTEGRLFGAVTSQDIAEAVTNAGVKLDKREVRIADGSIRSIGEHAVVLALHPDVVVDIQVNVVAE
ncbi:50S ribosomal protein L9 [Wohlfahrtiimonas chitiniclastica]|uniref:Large ribosomal subunit protein bL9 n=2 Tax=Wohlfahrtiimonas chitiniclastica TaxID=400946 RepID=L8Y2P9_9GAMM|nr:MULTISPECIES: 50S ribosomal protein L9 [Wohlfahrtiimonas]ELV08736.1 50S ribosomal protein L9 [Wohlfahrtiimonas chitiniclastica SH04]KZS22398.1 50S ribosomal protein L9 [Wohlfahrtiimonas chitiniclastica]KZX37923.1 50S ribosomal protein L9 [Wohlfahrtiimonas chitiniclastica]MBS7814004.1 50S ribosomal protein L9 [Wohlfahrtiimonas chitiniclastica]MBS7816267.1 50S ribosomal protein L9 [Wohlfahrtiimonas chitiniclastica]